MDITPFEVLICLLLHVNDNMHHQKFITTILNLTNLHRVPKLVTPLQTSWCKIVNTWHTSFTKCETIVETNILN